MNLKKYFDKIYCINLDHRKDRWEETKKELIKWGLYDCVERFDAIDGKKIEINNSPLNKGELGILLTQKKIIEECIDKKYNNILILEDDIEFTEEILKLENYMVETPDDWDMIYFGGNHNKHMGNKLNFITNKILKLNETYGIHSVAIKNTMFEKINNLISNTQKPVDVYYSDLQKNHNCYGFFPSMALQRESFSDIQNTYVNYKWLF